MEDDYPLEVSAALRRSRKIRKTESANRAEVAFAFPQTATADTTWFVACWPILTRALLVKCGQIRGGLRDQLAVCGELVKLERGRELCSCFPPARIQVSNDAVRAA